MRRGQIRWYRFKPPDKRRPVLIITRDAVIDYMGEVSVAPVTSTIRDIPSEVLLTRDDGMTRECAVNCDHIQTVSKDRLGKVITTLSPSRMQQVRRAILFALGL